MASGSASPICWGTQNHDRQRRRLLNRTNPLRRSTQSDCYSSSKMDFIDNCLSVRRSAHSSDESYIALRACFLLKHQRRSQTTFGKEGLLAVLPGMAWGHDSIGGEEAQGINEETEALEPSQKVQAKAWHSTEVQRTKAHHRVGWPDKPWATRPRRQPGSGW